MDLKDVVTQTLTELDLRKDQLDAQEADLKKEAQKNKDKAKQLDAREKELEEARAKVAHVEDVVSLQASLETHKGDLLKKQTELVTRERELAKWENKLVVIQDNQRETGERLRKQEEDLIRREAEYKQKIQDEFIKSVTAKIFG